MAQGNGPTDAAIVKAIKKVADRDGNYSEAAVAKELGVSPSALGGRHFRLEVEAFPKLAFSEKGASLNKAIVRARNEGIRWERIAARADMSVSEAREAYEKGSGKKWQDSYAGRGRNYSGVKRATPAASSGRRKAASDKKATSGRRAAAGRSGGGRQAAGRARTRGEKAAGRGRNPS